MKPPQKHLSGLAALALDIPIEEREKNLREQLEAIHGQCRSSTESGGKHLNLICPKCLEQYGARELGSKHLAFNTDKFFRVGKWAPKLGAKAPRGYAQCMKEHGSFSLVDLLGYTPLSERGYPHVVLTPFVERNEQSTYIDKKGREVPNPPGTCTPVHQLSQAHPCTQYLQARDYDPMLLWAQFGAAYCVQGRREQHPDEEWGIKLAEQHGRGWRNTPQSRLIFFSRMQGSNIAWQARVLEHEGKYLHPYSGQWVEAQPIKYQTGKGSLRNRQICGYDHAIASIVPGDTRPLCVITEGPLDAARFPKHGLAILGKYMSEEQALLIRLYFSRAVLAFDAGEDKAGAQVHAQVKKLLESKGMVVRDFWDGSLYDRNRDQTGNGKIDAGAQGYTWCRTQFNNVMNF